MSVTYYCPNRPPAPGAVPAIGLTEAEDFGGRRYIFAIDRMAWGCVRYTRELTFDEVEQYELIKEPRDEEP